MVPRARVELVTSMPCGAEVLHDQESGDGPVVWVVEHCFTASQAGRFEERINAAALARGRCLSTPEILRLISVAV